MCIREQPTANSRKGLQRGYFQIDIFFYYCLIRHLQVTPDLPELQILQYDRNVVLQEYTLFNVLQLSAIMKGQVPATLLNRSYIYM